MSSEASGLFLVVLVILSAFFSGAETALVSLSPARVRNLVNNRRAGAFMVERLKARPQRLLITILICNNLVNIGASVFATVTATRLFGEGALAYVTGILTLLILVFGEIFPKTLAHKFADQFSLLVAWPLEMLQYLLLPIIWLLEKLIIFINRIVGIKTRDGAASSELVTEDELKAMIDISTEEGALHKDEARIIERVIDFHDVMVQEVMTPRPKICAVSCDKTVEEAVEIMVLEGLHSRLPVYREQLENPIGFVTLRHAVNWMQDENLRGRLLSQMDLSPPLVVPMTQNIDILFKEFQWKHVHIALVVDQHGSVVGLVTMEDLLEELMGEIRDETDMEERREIIRRDENSWSIDANVDLGLIEKETGAWLGEDHGDGKTQERKSLSLVMIEKLGRIPRVGKQVFIGENRLTVEKMDQFAIRRVRLDKIPE